MKCKNCGHELTKKFNGEVVHAVGMMKMCCYLTDERCCCANPEPEVIKNPAIIKGLTPWW